MPRNVVSKASAGEVLHKLGATKNRNENEQAQRWQSHMLVARWKKDGKQAGKSSSEMMCKQVAKHIRCANRPAAIPAINAAPRCMFLGKLSCVQTCHPKSRQALWLGTVCGMLEIKSLRGLCLLQAVIAKAQQ